MIAAEDMEDYTDNVGGIVVAAYEFTKENDDELDVEEGTRLRTLDKRDEWWLAETLDGAQCGLIPVSYCMSEAEYEKMQNVYENGYDVDEMDLNSIPDIAIPAAKAEEEEEQEQVVDVEEEAQEIEEEEEEDVNDVAYDELAAKFDALQKKVADVKLTIESSPKDEENSAAQETQDMQAPPPPSPSQAMAHMQQQAPPPPPSPSQAMAQMQQQAPPPPPPSPSQAMAQMQQQQPPPPSAAMAQAALARQEMEAEKQRQLEAEKRRLAEEESQRRALELRRRREEELRVQKEAREREMRERQQLNRVTHRNQDGQQEGRAAMQAAIDMVKNAVAADNNGREVEAYGFYVQTLELFAKVLNSGAMRPQYGVIVERMNGYLQRMSVLEPRICGGVWSDGKPHPGIPPQTRFKDRVRILETMARVGAFDLLAEGDELRLKGRFAESQSDIRQAFRSYSEALEFYMAFHHLQKSQGVATNAEVLQHLSVLLDTAEKMKNKLL